MVTARARCSQARGWDGVPGAAPWNLLLSSHIQQETFIRGPCLRQTTSGRLVRRSPRELALLGELHRLSHQGVEPLSSHLEFQAGLMTCFNQKNMVEVTCGVPDPRSQGLAASTCALWKASASGTEALGVGDLHLVEQDGRSPSLIWEKIGNKAEDRVEELAKQYIRRGAWGVRSLPGTGVCTWDQPAALGKGRWRAQKEDRPEERPLRLATALSWDIHCPPFPMSDQQHRQATRVSL
ncbi:uncharacterized protein LOC115499592 isoform X1 [Lynx canadensis]|uniref:uncharacterized protein LOC115499592 isoform X1 n=1 Tax=Lynx canadensis TaxID=61383 RepID=UPI0011B0DED4|nr:uncharacterized protein LOC115499592 isoform X1 [Lynx canadensis]